MTLTFGNFEIRYFFGSNYCEVKMRGKDGYYIYTCAEKYYEEFYYDKRAIQTFYKEKDPKFPNVDDFRRKGILSDGYVGYDCYDGTGKLADFTICDILKNGPSQLMERIKYDIDQKKRDEKEREFDNRFRRRW